jgi:hypothetical protein
MIKAASQKLDFADTDNLLERLLFIQYERSSGSETDLILKITPETGITSLTNRQCIGGGKRPIQGSENTSH